MPAGCAGKYREGDELRHCVTPDKVVDNFAAAVEWILQAPPH
jgi:hypothetical protein